MAPWEAEEVPKAGVSKAQGMDKRDSERKGMVIVNTGNGKGKTSAAIGVLFRAWGRGMRVIMLQFIKHSTANFGEHRAARKIGVEIKPMGDGFTWRSKDIEVSKGLAVKLWTVCKEKMVSGEYDIVILDEFTYTLHYGWIPIEEALEALRNRPGKLHVIITGRHAPQELIDYADLVTEMREIKHPYKKGIKAQPGIEF